MGRYTRSILEIAFSSDGNVRFSVNTALFNTCYLMVEMCKKNQLNKSWMNTMEKKFCIATKNGSLSVILIRRKKIKIASASIKSKK